MRDLGFGVVAEVRRCWARRAPCRRCGCRVRRRSGRPSSPRGPMSWPGTSPSISSTRAYRYARPRCAPPPAGCPLRRGADGRTGAEGRPVRVGAERRHRRWRRPTAGVLPRDLHGCAEPVVADADDRSRRGPASPHEPTLEVPFAERAGCDRLGSGVASIPLRPDGLNASGTLNGGLPRSSSRRRRSRWSRAPRCRRCRCAMPSRCVSGPRSAQPMCATDWATSSCATPAATTAWRSSPPRARSGEWSGQSGHAFRRRAAWDLTEAAGAQEPWSR